MVKEALSERASMLHSAPHLTHPIPIMLPVYKYVVHIGPSFVLHQALIVVGFFVVIFLFQMVATAILLGGH